MAKKLSKSAKLDLIVTELAKVKTELKKLSKQHADLAGELNKRIRPAAPARKPAKTTRKPAAPAAKAAPVREGTSKRPVLVQSPEAPPAAGRAG